MSCERASESNNNVIFLLITPLLVKINQYYTMLYKREKVELISKSIRHIHCPSLLFPYICLFFFYTLRKSICTRFVRSIIRYQLLPNYLLVLLVERIIRFRQYTIFSNNDWFLTQYISTFVCIFPFSRNSDNTNYILRFNVIFNKRSCNFWCLNSTFCLYLFTVSTTSSILTTSMDPNSCWNLMHGI